MPTCMNGRYINVIFFLKIVSAFLNQGNLKHVLSGAAVGAVLEFRERSVALSRLGKMICRGSGYERALCPAW